mmetsp:Transcript_58322/g.115761  ORF Transcript_58322/g.115761 Transcript_58322/m.115761 type:complete len:482 (-) Transcript_58322:1092-2537(-)
MTLSLCRQVRGLGLVACPSRWRRVSASASSRSLISKLPPRIRGKRRHGASSDQQTPTSGSRCSWVHRCRSSTSRLSSASSSEPSRTAGPFLTATAPGKPVQPATPLKSALKTLAKPPCPTMRAVLKLPVAARMSANARSSLTTGNPELCLLAEATVGAVGAEAASAAAASTPATTASRSSVSCSCFMAAACARRCFWVSLLRLSLSLSRSLRASTTTASLAASRWASRAADKASSSPPCIAPSRALSALTFLAAASAAASTSALPSCAPSSPVASFATATPLSVRLASDAAGTASDNAGALADPAAFPAAPTLAGCLVEVRGAEELGGPPHESLDLPFLVLLFDLAAAACFSWSSSWRSSSIAWSARRLDGASSREVKRCLPEHVCARCNGDMRVFVPCVSSSHSVSPSTKAALSSAASRSICKQETAWSSAVSPRSFVSRSVVHCMQRAISCVVGTAFASRRSLTQLTAPVSHARGRGQH